MGVLIEVFFIFSIAFLAHELAHTAVAYAAGWRLVRPAGVAKWGGLGLMFDMRGNRDATIRVAVAGPLASAVLALFCIPWVNEDHILIMALFGINAAMVIVNTIPYGPSDGHIILHELRRRRAFSKSL